MRGDVTSREAVSAPAEERLDRREGERALAITMWPRERAWRAMCLPKPDAAPVMNHTGGEEGDVEDIVCGGLGWIRKLRCVFMAWLWELNRAHWLGPSFPYYWCYVLLCMAFM